MVPNGELVPIECRTFGGRKLVLILLAEGKARYQTMVGHSEEFAQAQADIGWGLQSKVITPGW